VQAIAIVALCVAAAVGYGIVHDQITARICVEYFTIGHPPVFGTDDPTLLGLGWDVIATWWVGVMLGVPTALVARVGSRPKRDARSLVPLLGGLLATVAVMASLAGVVGYRLASSGRIHLFGWLAKEIPSDIHVRFLVCACMHDMSYFTGFVGGLVCMALIWRWRAREARTVTVAS
jgi:hypothetical protein